MVSKGIVKSDRSERAALTVGAAVVVAVCTSAPAIDDQRIQPWPKDPRYWQYRGEPILLIGGNDQDNLFNQPNLGENGLEAHLDLMLEIGGNYVRNTMTSRERMVEGNPFLLLRPQWVEWRFGSA